MGDTAFLILWAIYMIVSSWYLIRKFGIELYLILIGGAMLGGFIVGILWVVLGNVS